MSYLLILRGDELLNCCTPSKVFKKYPPYNMLGFIVDVLGARIYVVATVGTSATSPNVSCLALLRNFWRLHGAKKTLAQRHVARLHLDFATTARRFDLQSSCAPANNTTMPDDEPSSSLSRLFVVGVYTRDQVAVPLNVFLVLGSNYTF